MEKISAWNLTKVRSKKEVIDEARTKGAKVHFASLMDICHLKKAELEAKHQKFRVISRLPGCTGQAGDAVSAYTQVKWKMLQKLLKLPKSECPDIWIRLPRHKMVQHGRLSRSTGIPWQDCDGRGKIEKILLKHGWVKVSNWECFFVHRQKRVVLICVCG